jgi:hypothetical protein
MRILKYLNNEFDIKITKIHSEYDISSTYKIFKGEEQENYLSFYFKNFSFCE